MTSLKGRDMKWDLTRLAILGHFLFTIDLLSLLKSTAAPKDTDVRIVTVRFPLLLAPMIILVAESSPRSHHQAIEC